MSHCSSFDIKFRDKQVLFNAMRNLDMKPENRLWVEYKSQVLKKANLFPNIIGRLLTGYCNELNVFFVEENGIFSPVVESHQISGARLDSMSEIVIKQIQKEYVKCSLEKTQKSLMLSGLSSTMRSEINGEVETFYLEIGNGKRLVISIDGNKISENVEGVRGRSCVDFSSIFESLIGEKIERQWKTEYHEVIEDQELQVLRLTY